VRVWDPATGVCVLTLRGPTGAVLAARFTPDGKRVVAVDQTEAITIWDTTPVTQYTDPAVLERFAPPPADEPDPAPAPEGDRP
jgi:WD40 repeat protein